MNIINFMEKEEWKYIYEFDDFNNKEKFFVTICENTGTKINVETQSISDRKDLCVFIPTLFLDMSNSPIKKDVKKIVKNNFFKGYESDYFPITKSINNNIKVVTIKNKVSISFNGVKKNINFSDDALIFFKKNYFISLIIKIEHEIYITRLKVRGKKEFPIFAIKYITIKSIKNKSLDLLIKSINTNDFSILANDKLFLDCIGTSDYEVYQSTSSEESLPSVSKLKFGSSCYNCGKNEVSKEHCSPKWLSDKYNVKPLIGDFLCKECNNKFGEIYENGTQELLLKKEWNEEEKNKVVKWCFKTSLTMSIASGVAINIDFLRNLENNLPENIEIYFNKNIPFNEKGFNYGVSKFNKELTKNNTFLFTFICTDFSFFVISKNTLNSDNIPYNKIYPDFNILRDDIAYKFNNIADFHKKLHEYLSGEKTTDFTLPIRKQKR